MDLDQFLVSKVGEAEDFAAGAPQTSRQAMIRLVEWVADRYIEEQAASGGSKFTKEEILDLYKRLGEGMAEYATRRRM